MNNVRTLAVALAIACSAAIVVAERRPTETFETFVPGSPNGQFGWKSLGSAGAGCANYDHVIDFNRTRFVSFGTRSLRMSNAITTNCLHDQTFSPPVIQEAGEPTAVDAMPSGGRQPYFVFEFDFASVLPDTHQEGLAVAMSADNGEGARMSWIEIADAPTGLQVTFADYQNGFVFTTFATGLDRTALHHVRVEHYFYEGPNNDVVIATVDNGAFVHEGTSWEQYYRQVEGTPYSRVVRSIMFHTRSVRGTAPNTQYFGFEFDNVEQASGPIPAPPPEPVGPPTDKDQCKKGGWREFNNPSFRNQGQCVAYVKAHEHDHGHGHGRDRGHRDCDGRGNGHERHDGPDDRHDRKDDNHGHRDRNHGRP